METSSYPFWPGGVPASLWNYDRQLPGLPEAGLPLTDIALDGTLLMNFGIGIVVIWLYAWNRFNKRSYEPTQFDYRVLRELLPAQMRDPLLMQRAYVVYAVTLTLVYAVLSFFGGIVFVIMRGFPLVGPQFNVDPALVASAQWPLILAFAMVGLTQLIGPLDHLERSLRRYVHQQLGIPILVKEYTRRFIDLQLREIQGTKEYPKLTKKGGLVLRDWAEEEIKQTYEVEDVRAKAELSWRMIDGLRAAGWPDAGVRDDTRQSVARELREAWTSMLYLIDLIAAPRQSAPPRPRADQSQPPAKAADAPESPCRAKAAEEAESPPEVQRTRQEQQLVNAVDSMERHLYEMGAIYAIYAQRDRAFGGIPDPALRAAVVAVFGRDAYGPSVRQVLCCVLVVFFAYVAGIGWSNQDLMARLPFNIWTIGLSALYETIRTLNIFLWPVLLAIYATTPNLGPRDAAPRVAGRVLSALIWGGLAGAVLMLMTALLYTWLVARNSDVFMQLLFGRFSQDGTSAYVMFFQSFAPISALVAAGVVLARLPLRQGVHVAAMCGVALLAMVLSKLREVLLYPGPTCDWSAPTFALPECLAYNFVDMVIPAVVVLFLCQNAGRDVSALRMPRAALAAVLGGMLLVPMAGQGRAQEPDTGSVRIGLRADVPPFSYRNTSGGEAKYKGYIADLCFGIFAESKYRLEAVDVTAQERFVALNGGPGPAPDPALRRIDVLCDPVTLRYEDRERWRNAIFSPVVFASSVTYMQRKTELQAGEVSTMLLGYVRGTTAAAVAREFCRARGAENICPTDVDVSTDPEVCDPDKAAAAKAGLTAAPVQRTEVEAADPQGLWARFAGALRKKGRAAPAEAGRPRYVTCPLPDHRAAATWFCGERRKEEIRFYFGDNEIIHRALQDWEGANGTCPTEPGGPALTYEPYALMTTTARPDLVQFVQRRIYEIFSDEGRMQASFGAYFKGSKMTPPLAYLFLLNGVAGPRRGQQADCRAGAVDPACAR